ncbi:MAG: HipA domain-containing protein [Bacteroidales bacterium]|nr:HipA domain-containing protein [Bacteroidales bacterium]
MDIYVYIDAAGLTDKPLFIGTLRSDFVRGKEMFSFRADAELAKSPFLSSLDADLQPYRGEQYPPEGKENFGVFLDSCPDRWGKVLMQGRERLRAKQSGRQPKKLYESDYLLGVFDGNRMGALRYKTDHNGAFLDNDSELATPPSTSLRALEQASLNYEQDTMGESPEYREWIRMLYSPGSSLGGARPKANVLSPDGQLWIAKFPSRNDDMDIGAWEYIATQMAREFGLRVPETSLIRYSSRFHTFLTKRFDRDTNGGRIHFASAMTLLGYTDGDDAETGVGYLELAEFLQRFGNNHPKEELKELWKRIVFNIAINNCDDHLRNHGFILGKKGWTLSPAYDLTPSPYMSGLKLNITENDNTADFELALETASFYGIDTSEAHHLIDKVKRICSQWQRKAKSSGLSSSEQEMMSTAFERCL